MSKKIRAKKKRLEIELNKKFLKDLADSDNYGWCEWILDTGSRCGSSFGVAQAHRMKRRKLRTMF